MIVAETDWAHILITLGLIWAAVSILGFLMFFLIFKDF